MQTHNLQKIEGIEPLALNAQNIPREPVNGTSVPNDEVNQFIIVLTGGIAWGTILSGFNGACIGASLAIVLSYLARKH